MLEMIFAGILGAVGGVVVNRLIHKSSSSSGDEELFDELIGKLWMKEHLIAKNRITQYMGAASAYHAVLMAIEKDMAALANAYPQLFTFTQIGDATVEIRDFQTTGVVAFAKGTPFSQVRAGKQDIGGHRVQVKEDYRLACLGAMDTLVSKL